MNRCLPIVLLLMLIGGVAAQTPQPTPPENETIKISTNLIQVDVTVTDRNGNVVTDLKPEDFEIYENGQKQPITDFSFVSIDNRTAAAATQPTGKPDKNGIPIPPVKLKAEQVRRAYALVVDDLGLSFGNVFWVQQSLRKFINEQMQNGDLVAVIRTGSGIGALQSFTSDKRQLLAAVDKIKWNAYGREGIGTFAPIETTLKEDLAGVQRSDGTTKNPAGDEQDKEFQKQVDQFRNENFSVGTLGALSYIIRGMRDLPGRKAILLFSQGFPLRPEGRILDSTRVLIDLANRSSVLIYTLDPRGLVNPLMANADDVVRNVVPTDPGGGRFDSNPIEARATTFRESQMFLRFIAEETGGIAFLNQNNLDKGILQAVNDQSGYYLLGYQPDDETFDPKKSKFNRLEVKLLRPGLKIRYRSGFFGITDDKMQNVAAVTPQQKLFNALTSPFGANEVSLSLYPIFENDAGSGDRIQALIHIDGNDLQFARTPEGKQKAVFDIIATIFGDNGMLIEQSSKVYTLELAEKVHQNMLRNGLVYTLSVPVKKAGAYQFRIALRDAVSNKVGSASQFIEVPNIKKRMALSNLVLDNFTPDEWQKIKLGASRDESEKSVLLDAALRRFRSGTILRYDFVIYNPKQSRQLKTQMRLIKDGRVVHEEAPVPVKAPGPTDPTRLPAAGALTLGRNLEPGSYLLQVIVTDEANAKNLAAQFVEFEIIQ